jgi:alpha-tubulin suppressor-like RCC1 family protein
MTTSTNPEGYTFSDGAKIRSAPNKMVKKIISQCCYNAWGVLTYDDQIITQHGARSWYVESGTGYQNYHMPTKLNFGLQNTGSKIKDAKMTVHSFVLFENGDLYLWGNNLTGSCGLASSNALIPYRALTGVNRCWIEKNYGWHTDKCRTFVEKTDGTIWATGYNEYGTLGIGNSTNQFAFVQVTALGTNQVKNLWSLGSIYGCTVVQKTDNTIWVCGYNGYGQLGTGDTATKTSFTDVTTAWGGAEEITDVTGGFGYYDTTNQSYSWLAMIVKSTKTVYTAGSNNFATIGNSVTPANTNYSTPVNTGVSGVTSFTGVGGGPGSIHCIKSDGTYWNWGYNSYGQLGRGNTTSTSVPAQVLTGCSEIMLKEFDGNTYSYRNCTFIKKQDGTMWCCGRNPYGELGLNHTTDQTTFVQNIYLTNATQICVNGYSDAFLLSAINSKGEFVQWGYSYYQIDSFHGLTNYTIPTRRAVLKA